MRRTLALLAFVLLAPSADAAVWRPASTPRSGPLTVQPKRSTAYTADVAALRRRLSARKVIRLPAPDGTLERFRVRPLASMAAGRARTRSGFHGYAGTGVDEPSASVRLDYSVLGIHASVRSRRGTWYVDPAFAGRTKRYLSYFGRALPKGAPRTESTPLGLIPSSAPRALRAGGGAVTRRTYRVALASDPSYATAVAPTESGATLDAKVTAAKQTLLSRVDQIYEDELAIHLVLVAGNAALNFNTSSPYASGGCDSATVFSTNTTKINTAIGVANYDLGHVVFGPAGDGGGLAGLGVVGDAGRKAEGCTGLSVPYGDAFAVDYVAHEMGHQFGADHTFNGTTDNCGGGNRNAGTAVEPGSGSSIMAYAGICGADDIQQHSDPYFSQRSIQEIQAYVAGTGHGGSTTATGNTAPVVTAPVAAFVPPRTPFTLTGTGTDAQPLVFTWEENDTGAAATLGTNARGTGPLFRQFGSRSSAGSDYYTSSSENQATAADRSRTFPDPAQIAAGNTNATTGSCPTFAGTPSQIDCYSELLPTSARTLKFRLTARDLEGGVAADDTTVTVAGECPFRVVTASGAADPGATVPVVWDRAGTSGAPFNVSEVSIAYSTDGGLTFPTTLLGSTPNDGIEPVVIPGALTPAARFRVAAVGGPFFDISHVNMNVTPGGGTPAAAAVPPASCSTPTPSVEPSAEPSASAVPSVTAAPSATPTVIARGALRPDLTATSRRLKVSRRGTVRVRVSCLTSTAGTTPARCIGTLRATRKRAPRTLARVTFAVPAKATRTLTIRLSRKVYRGLRHKRLSVRLRATVGTRTAERSVVLRRSA